jgi:hypothetical protein
MEFGQEQFFSDRNPSGTETPRCSIDRRRPLVSQSAFDEREASRDACFDP